MILPAPQLWPDGASIDSRCHLMIGGCDTVELARSYGTPLYLLDDPGHRRRLPGSRGAEEGLEAVARLDSLGELGDRLRLVGHRRIRLRGFELRHRAKRLPGDYVQTDGLASQRVERPRRPSRHSLLVGAAKSAP